MNSIKKILNAAILCTLNHQGGGEQLDWKLMKNNYTELKQNQNHRKRQYRMPADKSLESKKEYGDEIARIYWYTFRMWSLSVNYSN